MNLTHNITSKNGALSSLELLAPAGGLEQLIAAVNFGADAVYLGLDQFSMRAKAKNFSFDELSEGVKIAHSAGVKVHVTLNIQMHEDDLKVLPSYFEKIQAAGVDAAIIGDIGAMQLLLKHAPGVELHVSTQAAVANSESAKAFYQMGASRVVLAREMTMSEISEFRLNIPPELEVEAFVHGAQCMAQSGRCLISSYLCDRSANRGACTQPCRWGYHVVEEKRPGLEFDLEEVSLYQTANPELLSSKDFLPAETGMCSNRETVSGADEDSGVRSLTYLFNAQDLCMIDHLQELADVGVNSIKIEGRNKKAFYVASVVGAYRRVLDGAAPESVHEELECVSHRPYSCGFYYANPRQSLDFDGYTQQTLHVADVLDCTRMPGSDEFELTIRCRNKICQDEQIEALIPKTGVKTFSINNFVWLDKLGVEREQEEVNRPGELYHATSKVEIPKGSFLRKREERITSRAIA